MKFVATLLGLGLVYAAACAWLPYAGCWACSGAGMRRSMIRRSRMVDCRLCASSGRRLRTGRRIYNVVARARREGQARRTERAAK